MSILKYCKLVPSLPNPTGPSSAKISLKAIELANAEVEKVSPLSKDEDKKTRGPRATPYLILSPARHFEVGKRAAEHGVTSMLRYFSKKYPHLALKETTVKRLKNLYQIEVKRVASNHDGSSEDPLAAVHEFPHKKTGRPLLLGKDLDTQVQEYLRSLCKLGMPINTSIVIASARGIVMNKNAHLLVSNGGGINLTKDWAKYLLKCMGFVKRKACSKSKVDVEQFQDLKETFLLEIKNTVVMDDIPEDLIINFVKQD